MGIHLFNSSEDDIWAISFVVVVVTNLSAVNSQVWVHP